MIDRSVEEPPPIIVAVHGPPGVGKSSLIRSLVKHYTLRNLKEVKGPVTVVTSKTRRTTFVEVPNDLSAAVDIAKVADLVLLLIDAAYGFEMETFEFLNVLQAHGFPKIMGVLTHLDVRLKIALFALLRHSMVHFLNTFMLTYCLFYF